MEAVLATIQTTLIENINAILPVAGTLFALIFGIRLIPRIIKSFVR
jgi:hypothetical protein